MDVGGPVGYVPQASGGTISPISARLTMTRRPKLRNAFAAIALVAGLAGCDPDGPAPGPRAPTGQLMPWAGPWQALFDDGIDPAAVGTSLEARDPASDPLLKDRTRTAELVARMRVKSSFRNAYGDRVQFQLQLQIGYQLLRPRITDPEIELTISAGTGAFGLLNENPGALKDRVFIGFVRRFVGPNGTELHWHLTADTVEVARAVEAASALQDLAH